MSAPSAARVLSAAALKATLSLPAGAAASLPMRGSAAREAAAAPRLTTELYVRQAARGGGARAVWRLADGPPYANGALHMGHFLNKVLKDVLNRRALLGGARVAFAPGWDCHGLPIELLALAAGAAGGKPPAAAAAAAAARSPLAVRATARAFAAGAVRAQAADFARWGVLADWEDVARRAQAAAVRVGGTPGDSAATSTLAAASPAASGGGASSYLTMDASYEAAQLHTLAELVARGFVVRDLKPVWWSPSSGTALAEAELEYVEQHVSTAAWVTFPLRAASAAAAAALRSTAAPPAAAVWTTTPWTLPANVALAVGADLEYAVVEEEASAGRAFVVQADRVTELARVLQLGSGSTMPVPLRVRATVLGRELVGSTFAQPLDAAHGGGGCAPVIAGAHVTADAGSGVVHTAPGHGHEDFVACAAHAAAGGAALGAPCPVDGAGVYTPGAGAALTGLPVLGAGGVAVLAALRAGGMLLAAEPLTHRYPYDWRTRKPVIVRATQQWFVRLGTLAAQARAALAGVELTPPAARRRLEAALGGRSEWCISRQRAWGVPVPALFVRRAGAPADAPREAIMTPDVVRHAAAVFAAAGGSDAWWTLPVAAFVPPALAAELHGADVERGADTLDVWFDSGVSWAASGAAPPPADAVLEGSDQHRGWFQSSLLTAVAATGAPPYREVITHGFVLDEHGRKMSKSLGNVLLPADLIDGGGSAPSPRKGGKAAAAAAAAAPAATGAAVAPAADTGRGVDLLRYWVASVDYTRDAALGPAVLATVAEAVRKVRISLRFLLANVHDFDVLAGAADVPTDAAELALRAWAVPPPRPPAAREREEAPPGWGSCGFDGSALLRELVAPAAAPQLGVIDRCFLYRLSLYAEAVDAAYARRDLQAVTGATNAFLATDLSAQYLDLVKDRLYAGDGPRRAGAQAVMWATLQQLLRALAPVLPFTAEEAFQLGAAPLLRRAGVPPASAAAAARGLAADALACATVFDVDWRSCSAEALRAWQSAAFAAEWAALHALRGDVHRGLEALRAAKLAGGALEVGLHLTAPAGGAAARLLRALREAGELEDAFLTSSVEVAEARADGEAGEDVGAAGVHIAGGAGAYRATLVARVGDERVAVALVPAAGAKCARCWKVKREVVHHAGGVCARCDGVVAALGAWPRAAGAGGGAGAG